MRTRSSDTYAHGHRGQRLNGRLKKTRKSRDFRFDLEGLELRTLLATLPAATLTTSSPANLSQNVLTGPNAKEGSALVAIDPLDPQKMVTVWVNNDTIDIPFPPFTQVYVDAKFSLNGGQTWSTFSPGQPSPEVILGDPNTVNPVLPYQQQTNPSVAFDRNGNFYLLVDQHNGAGTSGALVLEKFAFTGDTPVQERFNNGVDKGLDFKVIYQWLPPGDQAFEPTMAVDDNVASFTDPTTGDVQTDPSSGNVYIAWATGTVAPAVNTLGALFNPNTIAFVASSDGGQNFTAQQVVNTSAYGPTAQRDSEPVIAISEGRLPSQSGQQGDAGVPGGQVTVGWADFGANQNQLMVNRIFPGKAFSFDGPLPPFGGIITGNANPPTLTTVTNFPVSISLTPAEIAALDSLSVTVDITDATDANLGLKLIAPDGESITLFTNNTVNGVAITGRGLTGTNLGINNFQELGTTFIDSAARSIVDLNANGANAVTGPAIGDFRVEDDIFVSDPDGRKLNTFLQKVIANGAVNGTWQLQAIDSNQSPPTTPSVVDFWSLNLSTGMTPDLDLAVPGTNGLIVAGSLGPIFPTTSVASPVGISPGLVLASDNTLGTFSPHQGRIYAAFVGYINVTVAGIKNPTDNTDIFLTHSDDGGRTWSPPTEVNNDVSDNDGSSESAEETSPTNVNDEVTGRVQFQPEIAVDPTTGTLVISWRDGRNDASRARVATYVTTSIDGGQTFAPEIYANPSQTAVNAITGATVVMGPETDNESSGDSNADTMFGYGTQMGLAVYDGQVYSAWAGNFNLATITSAGVTGPFPGIFIQPMVIAAGPRVISSDMGPISLAEASSGKISFTVTFDRPINPPSLDGYTTTPTLTPGDVLVYYHDTTNGDAPVPLQVENVAPVTSSGVGPDNKFGYTQFTITFDSTPPGANKSTYNYTGTYSYMILPDDGSGTVVSSPIRSFVNTPVPLAPIGPVASTHVGLPVPSSGTGGSGTQDDFTTSTITIANSNYIGASITGVTVNLTLDHMRDGDLTITLAAPNGNVTTLYSNPGDDGQNFISTTFSDQATQSILAGNAPYSNGPYQPFNPLAKLDGSQVNGIYTLTIKDNRANNVGTLVSWSITVNSSAPSFVLQNGAPMDQNADGTPDENPLTTQFTGTTPGDVYAVPTPTPSVPVAFGPNPLSILEPPFNQNTLPLIVPGPQILSTSVPTSGSGLVVSGTTSTFNVTFDRPMKVSTFTPAQILQIMGPAGSISGPQPFSAGSVDQAIPEATGLAVPGVLSSTLTVPDYNGTFTVGDVTLGLNITAQNDSNLSAVLIAPNGTQVALFSNVGGSGSSFTSTVFDDTAETSITNGSAPFTGSFQPSAKLASLVGLNASGTWTLKIFNNSQTMSGILVNWSLNITPKLTVTPLDPTTKKPTTASSTTLFQIGFPLQQLSGTYTIQLGSGIQDTFGDKLDTNQNAGVGVLRDSGQNSPTTTVLYAASDLPKAIPAPNLDGPGTVSSTIVVPDNFIVQGDTTTAGVSGLRVQIGLTYPNDPDLTATLFYNMGQSSQVEIPLFTNVKNGVGTANFTNTVFDDNAGTPIQSGSAPYFATFNPQMPLSDFADLHAAGTWTLVVTNSTTGSGATGTFNSWSLSFQKPLPTSGLGELGSDNASASFRIFTLSQTDSLSSEEWTSVGPGAMTGASGQVSAIAVDPSDPSGNTVYVAGASGGIWKTTDFLTTNPGGPTYIPVTDFGPSSGIYVNSIAVFARNSDPNQSLVIAGTGSTTGGPNHSSVTGVGFLISQDGGATWNLYDSSVNGDASGNLLPIASAARDRDFVGSIVNKIVVDPRLTSNNQVIIYAALTVPNPRSTGNNNGGIWRSEDSGKTWQLVLAGNASDVILDPDSGIVLDPTTDTEVVGNLQVVYAGMVGQGVFMSPNQGSFWSEMTGGIGNPLIVNLATGKNVDPPPIANPPSPNGTNGRIVLAAPAFDPNAGAAANAIYSGWLYAAVSTSTGGFDGLFVTKDFGHNWTQVNLATLPALGGYQQAVATNDVTQLNYAITLLTQGNAYLTLTADPTNPNIVYLGSFGGDNQASDTGLVRIDATNIWDDHALVAYSDSVKDTGTVNLNSTGPAAVNSNRATPVRLSPPFLTPDPTSYLNYIRDPQNPFVSGSTLYVSNYSQFTNNGAGVTWIPFDMAGTGYQASVSETDPTTGMPRLIFGNAQGVWSVLDNNGTFESSIGSSDFTPGISRNGNLQLTQFYYGAAQPSSAAAQVAGALFYGAAQDNGAPFSDPNILTDGNINWSVLNTPPAFDVSEYLNSSSVGVDQQGLGTVYQYWLPNSNGVDLTGGFDNTNFFQTDNNGRTFGLLQASQGLPTPDPQWPLNGIANFAVDPVNGSDVVITSSTGNVFATSNGGVTWFDIGTPASFGNPGNFSLALAYGAPDPGAPDGIGNLGNFIYVGTSTGQIYATQIGGGTSTGTGNATNNWILVGSTANGLDGSQIEQIGTDPTRGSHEAYAVTKQGVYVIANSIVSASNPTPKWINITGDIKNLPYQFYGQTYDPTKDPNTITYNQPITLSSIYADWEYSIPNSASDPSGPGFHPALFVGANSGVFMSLDNGQTWTPFPDTNFGAVTEGGYLPHVSVTSLSVSLGNIDPNTGMPNLAGPYDPNNTSSKADPDVMLATTFGQGAFAINMAPMVFPSSTQIDPGSVSGTAPDGTQLVTTSRPVFDGLSEITGFGNATRISILDETPGDPTFGKIIGGFDPSNVKGTNVAANWTSILGNFSIPVNAGAFTTNGLKTVEIYATDDAGSKGNAVTIQFTLAVTGISAPVPPQTPTLQLAPYDVTGAPGYTNIATPNVIGVTTPGATVELLQANGKHFSPIVTTTADPVTGTFTLTFPNPSNLGQPPGALITLEAVASNSNGTSGAGSTSFTIILSNPVKLTNFRLDPNDDTGIKGDDITAIREPHYIGTAAPGATVELFEVGNSTIWTTTTADSNGNFSVQLPFVLTNGQISLDVRSTDLAGNLSAPSNTLTVTVVSVASDYNGDSYADPALYDRNTTTNQGTWLVQATTPAGGGTPPPIWFPSGMTFGPANVVPFQGDFDGDGETDLAYYQPSTATWYMDESHGGLTSFPLGTPNSSIPVVGNFDANAPDEAAVYTVVNGQGVWTIASGITPRTVTFGQAGDIPVPGDYTGVGYDELAVYRPSTGQFLVQVPGPNNTSTTDTITIPGIGANTPDLSSLVPVPGNYDPHLNGATWVETTEAAVYDPKTGVYTILGPNGVDTPAPTFKPGDIPAPADYAGNGSTQAVVFRPSTGQFIGAGGVVIATFGQSGDIPLASPLSYRMPSSDPSATGTGGTGSTGTGSTGTGSTGTGSTGTGSTGTGSTGTGSIGTGSTGTGSTGTGSSGLTTPTPPPAQSPGSGTTGHHGKVLHKKTPKPKPKTKPKTAHHPKSNLHAKKTVAHHAPKKVKVTTHHTTKVVVTTSTHSVKPPVHVVDLALEDVHVNLRRSSSAKKHHG
jgi:subtilisin-like proprotein convertase family protein